MRQIEVDEGLRVRFPNRSEDFDDGVEIGIATALMAVGGGEISRPVAAVNLDQLRAVAEKLGYHIVVAAEASERADVLLRAGRPKTRLQLVHSTAASASVPPRRPPPNRMIARTAGAPGRADRVQMGSIS